MGRAIRARNSGAIRCSSLTARPTNPCNRCERIKKTPCPPGYVAIMRLLMIIWLVLLPFTLGTELKWGIVAITSVTAWTMLQVSSSVVT